MPRRRPLNDLWPHAAPPVSGQDRPSFNGPPPCLLGRPFRNTPVRPATFRSTPDSMRFVRVHRSAVVNIESIVQLDAKSHGEFDVVLKHGTRSRVSRTYRALLERRLGQSL